MPAVSKDQYRFMAAVEHGGIKKKGLSRSKAAEWVDSSNYKSLPAKAKKKRKRRNVQGRGEKKDALAGQSYLQQ